ncbi:hypothetical protein WMF38_40780 [Sorangium sp. So ce118]
MHALDATIAIDANRCTHRFMHRCSRSQVSGRIVSVPIHLVARLKEKGLSDRGAGHLVLAAWKKLEPRRTLPKASSIAAKLGELRRGQATWWSNHPRALEALAQVLECDPDDLLGSPQAAADELVFTDLPELPPLQAAEEPCFLDAHGWLGTRALHALGQGTHAWLTAAGGAGKTLAIHYVQRRLPEAVAAFTARTLVDAARRAPAPLPLVVEVELADRATDDAALSELTQRRANTCILAPFGRTSLGAQANERWQDISWQPHDGWRERLVRWVHGRLPEPTRLDVPALLEWLEDVDPSSTLFSTPGELLPLVGWCYRNTGRPTQATRLDTLAEDYFARLFESSGARHPWLRREGRSAVQALVRRRIENLDLPNEPLPIAGWAELLGPHDASGAGDDEVRRRIDAVARERSAEARKKRAEEALAALAACGPREAVHLLVERGVLRAQRDRRLDVYPTWARHALERRVFLQHVRSGDVQVWGTWSADASRRRSVDEALDTLGPHDLVEAAARVLREPRAELATAAATEALFAALGRRMLGGWAPTPKHVPTLQALGQRQAELLVRAVKVQLTTPTVALTRFTDSEWYTVAQWRFEAWAYSLRVPPTKPVTAELHWMMPGWADDLRLANAPSYLYLPEVRGGRGARLEDAPQHLDGVLAVSREVLQCCRDARLPEEIPEMFYPWLLVDAPSREWEIMPSHCRGALASAVLARILGAQPSETHERVIAMLWPYIMERAGNDPLGALLSLHHARPDLFPIVAEHLPRERFEDDLARTDLNRLDVQRLVVLPDDLRRVVLRSAARQLEAGATLAHVDLETWVEALGPEDLDLLVQFVPDRYSLGVRAARRVFEIDPARALDEARTALDRGASSASSWFYGAPACHWRALVDTLESHGVERVPWSARWLARMFPRAGTEARRMFRLLDRFRFEDR